MKLTAVEPGTGHKCYHGILKILNKIFDLEIISPNNFLGKNYKIIPVKRVVLFKHSFTHYPGVYKKLKKSNPDIVSVRPYYRMYSIITLLYSIIHRKKFIIMEEQRNDPENSKAEYFFFKLFLLIFKPIINLKCSRVICVTKPCFHYLKSKGFKNLKYIPLPWKSVVKKPKLRKGLKIICVARFYPLKDHDTLIKAINYLVKNKGLKDVKLDLYGKGILEKKLRKKVKRLGLEKYIFFKGHVPNNQINKIYQKHNLFVLPSKSDPIGISTFEAMANGLPIIVSSNVGAKGSILCGINGTIFKSKDYKGLANCLYNIRKPSILEKLGRSSLKLIKKQSFNKIEKEYEEIKNSKEI